MSSSDRRTVLTLLAALPVAACGFVPAYGPNGPAKALMGRVRVDDPGDKRSFDLVARLEERLGRLEAAAYRLAYTVTTTNTALGITQTNAITRYNVTGHVDYTLRSAADDSVLISGTVQNFTSYSASGTVVSTAASERDAYVRLMRLLADEIVPDMIAKSSALANP